MALPKRSEVPVNETWDLTAIYPDKKAWKADMVAVRELVTQFQNNYRSSRIASIYLTSEVPNDISSLLTKKVNNQTIYMIIKTIATL